jgi:hypothetical protein
MRRDGCYAGRARISLAHAHFAQRGFALRASLLPNSKFMNGNSLAR